MKVFFIGCGPGDVDLLTIKAKKIIEQSDMLIYAGSLINKEILEFSRKEALLFDSAKLDLEQIEALYKEAKEKRQTVGRLHSGDPSIYGAINEQMAVLDKLEIDYEVIPGVSSFLAAAAALKTEYTAPGVSQTVIITRMSGNTKVPESESLKELAKHNSTMCIFLSIQKISEVVKDLSSSYNDKSPVAVVYKASREDELIIRGTLSNIAEKVEKAKVSSTALIIIGESLNNKDNVSKLYDKDFSHMFRTNKV